MYADRYARQQKLSPGGVAFALGASGIMVFGLTLTTPNLIRHIDKVFVATSIDAPVPPPPHDPIPPKPETHAKQTPTDKVDKVDLTRSTIPASSGNVADTKIDDTPFTVTVGTGTEINTIPPAHVPVLRDPSLDSRYIDNFQPNYPSDERLAGREGRVVVRVLIGADGRVKDVQQVSAASTAFFEATRKQALAKWRFKPGTRDGVAIEAWHTMAVRFVLDEE